jgi:hypothetical protein
MRIALELNPDDICGLGDRLGRDGANAAPGQAGSFWREVGARSYRVCNFRPYWSGRTTHLQESPWVSERALRLSMTLLAKSVTHQGVCVWRVDGSTAVPP